MNKSLMLNQLKEYKNFNTDTQFAEFLGIQPQNLSKWKSRNTFDTELIYTKCPEINPEWLLTGEGEMLKKNNVDDAEKGSSYVNNNSQSSVDENEINYSNNDELNYCKIQFLKDRIKYLEEALKAKDKIIELLEKMNN